MEATQMTYKVDYDGGTAAHYTHDKKEAYEVFEKYKTGYGDHIRLYEAPLPKNDDDEIEWETIEYFDKDDETDEIQWKCTDPDTKQYGRRISTYKYEFKEEGKEQTIIDLEDYTWKEICDNCEGYYPNMDELFGIYGTESTWIIAECIYEVTIN